MRDKEKENFFDLSLTQTLSLVAGMGKLYVFCIAELLNFPSTSFIFQFKISSSSHEFTTYWNARRGTAKGEPLMAKSAMWKLLNLRVAAAASFVYCWPLLLASLLPLKFSSLWMQQHRADNQKTVEMQTEVQIGEKNFHVSCILSLVS